MNDTCDPSVYFHKPLEAWSFEDLTDALGLARSAEVLGMTGANVRSHRWRNKANLERMQALHAAIREDEQHYRALLVTIRAGGVRKRSRRVKPAVSST